MRAFFYFALESPYLFRFFIDVFLLLLFLYHLVTLSQFLDVVFAVFCYFFVLVAILSFMHVLMFVDENAFESRLYRGFASENSRETSLLGSLIAFNKFCCFSFL